MALSVDQRSPEVEAQTESWALLDALMGGTAAMRAAGAKYLPKEPREADEDWRYRLNTATLFPAYARTVSVMAGKPFAKAVTLSEENSDRIKTLCEDIDQQGRSLHAFSADLFHEVIGWGFGGVLVDYTKLDELPRTEAEARAAGARPYWVHYKHEQVLGWRSEARGGAQVLTLLRLSEAAEVPDGEYGTMTVQRVRVLRPGSWELWQAGEKQYELIARGTTTLPVIPFVPFYGRIKAFMVGAAPLMDLAHQNVKHWQQQSDQDDSARFARKRLLVFAGVPEDQLNSATVASGYAFRFDNPEAKVDVVQGSAECVTVGRTELEALEEQMIQTGAELLVAKPGNRTATESANDAEANKSDLQRIAEAFEDGLDQCLQYTADWLGAPEEAGNVSLFKDYAAATLSDASAQLIVTMQQGGLLTKATALKEQQRRGVLSPDIDPEQELEAVSEEGPPLGTIGAGDGSGVA